MQELIIVTNKKMIVAVPIEQIMKVEDGDKVVGVVLVDTPKKEE
jgi:hypothetical protein